VPSARIIAGPEEARLRRNGCGVAAMRTVSPQPVTYCRGIVFAGGLLLQESRICCENLPIPGMRMGDNGIRQETAQVW